MSDHTDGNGELDIETAQAQVQRVEREIDERIVGQDAVVRQLLVCLLTDGNALLEGAPGLGKTLLIRTLAETVDLSFSRIQNTPDLMPSDITGTEVIRESGDDRVFVFQEGPVFANVVLADEINRATPKTQAALLEAMEEGQVTAGGETRALPEPFFVLATQNPIDQEGTYPLPEAQRDRFTMKITIEPPALEEELTIVDRYTGTIESAPPVETVMTGAELRAIQTLVRQVPIADDITERAVRLVADTRSADRLEYGASPRASMALVVGAKARALLDGRAYVSEDDVEAVARPVLRHRVVVDFRAERDGVTPDDVIAELL
ncbi:AAA-type ATPase (MoxR subfamily) [Natronomonas moolapensis 8.8.11]|uniref:AAA-type ATPase (MoxR subfamily) n=1 Tax=Natronomonas moolapensis (strain DSM 18674 / CECT 7526 / JCM 14361 / 8.8.11) TaxID=268739 RepID=M1XSN8_NATM8|nr:MoxR family ATPase [Natronomonas moolapensis]CCQ37390.1 AAA-type ATPase (MoxR subfamily) [Natronomonas moolapensis 8.8.11]